jgi:hypothetical protein
MHLPRHFASLPLQVTAVSSAGVAFTYIGEVPPITLASWRLQLTAVITAAAGGVQWCTSMSPEHRARFRADLRLTALSGLALTVHFATWVWSLQVGRQHGWCGLAGCVFCC